MYVCNCIYGCDHLHTVDADPTHAAAAVNEEDELAMNLPQVWADGLEVGAEVQHDHRVVKDVLMEAPVNDVYLEKDQKWGAVPRQKMSGPFMVRVLMEHTKRENWSGG